jgi:hypothetical protein
MGLLKTKGLDNYRPRESIGGVKKRRKKGGREKNIDKRKRRYEKADLFTELTRKQKR